jgi:SET domain-containing protein
MNLPYRYDLPSPIHGVGVFAIRLIRQGELVPGGTYVGLDFRGFNHSCDPNLGPRADDQVSLRPALRDIQPGEEITVSYTHINFHSVFCDCKVCMGKHPSYPCNCPVHTGRR